MFRSDFREIACDILGIHNPWILADSSWDRGCRGQVLTVLEVYSDPTPGAGWGQKW